MRIRTAQRTDPGLQRPENEDSVLVVRQRAGVDVLLVVCDGMGGHAAGHLASTIAVETFADALMRDQRQGADPERLRIGAVATNEAVHQASQRNAAWAGMGSTLVAVAIAGDDLAVVNVGDSPAYLYRDGSATLITQDHSWPAEQVRLGLIKPEEAKDHPMRHRLTRAIGVWDSVTAYTDRRQLRPGDTIVLCSDGVETAGVSIEEMWSLLRGRDLDAGVKRVVDRCRELGAPDNVTVAVARLEPQPEGREEVDKTVHMRVLKTR